MGMTATRYTWTKGSEYCAAEIHRIASTCPDCTDLGQCQGCLVAIADGQPHLVCDENGEVVHPGCTTAATARWVDYF